MPDFLPGFRESNTGHYSYTARTWPTQPPPQPSELIFSCPGWWLMKRRHTIWALCTVSLGWNVSPFWLHREALAVGDNAWHRTNLQSCLLYGRCCQCTVSFHAMLCSAPPVLENEAGIKLLFSFSRQGGQVVVLFKLKLTCESGTPPLG